MRYHRLLPTQITVLAVIVHICETKRKAYIVVVLSAVTVTETLMYQTLFKALSSQYRLAITDKKFSRFAITKTLFSRSVIAGSDCSPSGASGRLPRRAGVENDSAHSGVSRSNGSHAGGVRETPIT